MEHLGQERSRGSTRIMRDRQRSARRGGRGSDLWSREEFHNDLRRGTTPITDAINADPKDAQRLSKSRQQVEDGEIHWGVEDEDEKKNDASG